MEEVTIICEECNGEITSRDDLFVTNMFYYIVPYHGECFSKEMKGLSTLFVGDLPINGTAGNLITILAVILGIIVLFIPGLRYFFAISLLFLGIRAYSWLRYERYLP